MAADDNIDDIPNYADDFLEGLLAEQDVHGTAMPAVEEGPGHHCEEALEEAGGPRHFCRSVDPNCTPAHTLVSVLKDALVRQLEQ